MAVPSTFADLSATPASNSGLIADSSAVNVIDDHFRTVYAFIASIYANSGNGWTSPFLTAANPSYTGTLTGGTGVLNLGSGQIYKDSSGNVGMGTTSPAGRLHVKTSSTTIPAVLDTSADTAPSYTQHRVNASAGWEVGMSQASEGYEYRWCYGTFGTSNNRLRLDSSGNLIQRLQGTVPTLNNQDAVLTFPNNSTVRLSFKGTDGTTRSIDFALA
jgi:hypothetical protein